MPPTHRHLARKTLLALGIAVLALAFVQRALQNLSRIDYRNSNFVFFWLAGRMVHIGQNPYDASQWLAQHVANGVTWRSDQVFSYPLPLAAFLAPLGLLSLEAAYVGWQLLSLVVVAASFWSILRASGSRQPQRVFFPVTLGLLFFGPVYLTLQIGALGALTLGVMTIAILALEKRHDFMAGAFLSVALLKPSQGIPIVILAVAWLLFRRSWRAIPGLVSGSLALLLAGLLLDPSWPLVFARSAQGLLTRNLGLHSNVFNIARNVCADDWTCTWLLGAGAALLAIIATLAFLWKRRLDVTPLGAFSLIIPIAFLTTVYSWSYDQVLYVIPLAWIVGRLTISPRGYIPAMAFTLLVLVVSLVTLAVHAFTGTDVLSSLTTLLILAGVGVVLAKTPPAVP